MGKINASDKILHENQKKGENTVIYIYLLENDN